LSGLEVLRNSWTEACTLSVALPFSGFGLTITRMTIDNKTATVKDLLRKSNFLYVPSPSLPYSSQAYTLLSRSISRIFTAPDGIDYKWKRVSVGNDPAFPESQFHALYSSDSQHPIATTARLTDRDGHGSVRHPTPSSLLCLALTILFF